MLKNQKNISPVLIQLFIFMLIQGLLIGPGFALNNVSPEHLSPRIIISDLTFSDLIKNSYSDGEKETADIQGKSEINLLNIRFQKEQRVVLQNQIIASFVKNYPDNSEDLMLIGIFFKIALEHYEGKQFESGEFYYNHCLEVAAIAAKNRAGFEEILAAVFHRMPTKKINPVVDSLFKNLEPICGSRKARAMAVSFQKNELLEINRLIKEFSEIVALKYHVHSQGANSIENFMGVPINKMQGDFRIMRLVLADKQASIIHASETEKADIVEEIQNIYGPFAGRFGMFEIKKELENSVFKAHDPQGYEMVMRKILNTYGVEYGELNSFLDKTKVIIQKIADDDKIKAQISSRVKSPYRIFVKEKISGKGQKNKDTLYGVDTIGIKVICENDDCFYLMTHKIEQALHAQQLGNWKIGRVKTIASGITYLNLKEIGGKGNLEVQFLTKEADDLREINFAHWSYEIARQTGRKQKFDNTENFKFYQLRDMYQAEIDSPEHKEVDINTVIEKYFASVYEQHKKWVYVFEKSSEVVNGEKIDVVKPKRLLRGANGPVFAAQTGVDRFDKDYAGLVFYEWRGSKLVPKKRQYDDLNQLRDGDIVEVKVSGSLLSDKIKKDLNYKLRLSSSINDFLRPKILLAQIDLDNADRNRYYKNAQSFLNTVFEKKGIVCNVKSQFSQNAKYIQEFLNEFAATKKLKDSDELFMAIALQRIDSSEVVNWAYERGLSILKNKIPIDDKGIQWQLKKIFGSEEKVFIEVGIGKISADKVFEELKARQGVNLSITPTISGDYSGRFEYNIEVKETDKKAIAAKTRKVKAQIIKIMQAQGIDFSDDVFNERKSRKIKGGFIVNFEVTVKYDQLPNIRTALLAGLETRVKIKTKRDKIERDTALTKVGLVINIQSKRNLSFMLKRISKIGNMALKDYDFDAASNQLSCIIEYDQLRYDLPAILGVLNVLAENVSLIKAEKLQEALKIDQFARTDMIESAI